MFFADRTLKPAWRIAAAGLLATIGVSPPVAARPAAVDPPLQLDVYVADEAHFGVTSTIIYGATEAILIDAQYSNEDAERVADRIAATRRKLKAIFVTHPDADHYLGLAVLHRRFPAAAIYMTRKALAEFQRTAPPEIASIRRKDPSRLPDGEPTPQAIPMPKLKVDGRTIDILEDLQGDYAATEANSAVWIPGQRTLISDDLVFNGVHPWLEGSTKATRRAWRASLARLRALKPRRLIAGHKRGADLPDSPTLLGFMQDYLVAFDEVLHVAPNAQTFDSTMSARFPGLGQARFLTIAAKSAYPK